ncbi:acyl-activating enzyme [Paracoccidioides lutzii Pb01]|uniref:Acyl-activating enzyme n=1 Tax=Paracoccidioides lutzii (strain ATCC MYA-826 / Pb01) TaxID=502779 RepID=C1HDV5_PARBA|nr:acyl-activating enzyme [Paracoccidioides lutzii Pb01]EEH40099.2 acyl-activating enzyme [Paracoccidioides lutzii Pb01]
MGFDRTDIVPSHTGDHVLPLSPFFSKLLRHAHRKSQRIAIRDVNLQIEKSYIEFLSDVLAVRNALRLSLSPETQWSLRRCENTYIALIAAGGYEYAVGFVAICALGAVVVPITVLLPVKEASYFVLKAKCAAILSSSDGGKLADLLAAHLEKTTSENIGCVHIARHFMTCPLPQGDIVLSSDKYLDDNGPGVVIFTSGTTGPPKGAVMRRAYLHDTSAAVSDHFGVTEKDVILHVLPVHHATGIGINFLPYIYSGACVEFRSGSFDVVWMWERWKKGGLHIFSGVPTIYMRMMRYFERTIAPLPPHEVYQYIAGARQFRAMLCGTSALPTPVQQFWSKILGGRTILSRYGASEIGPVFTPSVESDPVPPGSVGSVFPGTTVKLSDGEEGEVLIKGPYMFSKYLYDEVATVEAHDADGFFKTGDVARREGNYYFILGRASLDILKSGGYKISALDIEREILGLPYVSEVMVVGVADDEFGQRVAAVVSLRDDQTMYRCAENGWVGKDFTLDVLRRDLRKKLAAYKMPTLLRVVEGELPKSGTGKVVKKELGPKFFPADYHREFEVQVWDSNKKAKKVYSQL